ncbi:MAG: phage tail protein [Bryobacteraceae bacterium]
MTSPQILKEQEVLQTPLLIFDCELTSGSVEHWSTHGVVVDGITYEARVLQHNIFDLKAASTDGFDGVSRLSMTLSNVDSHLSQVERIAGWKGARLTVRFLFYELGGGAASDSQVVFLGLASSPEEMNESTIRLAFTNRLSLQRVSLPKIRIQRRCPWAFPVTEDQREDALTGIPDGQYGMFHHCGYSAGMPGGLGNLDGDQPFLSCDYSRTQCEQRGMFDTDKSGNTTRRFGGIEFVPSDINVRSYGDKASHISGAVENQARYNDCVPILYGTAWYEPPIVFARNDGNLTRLEVLLGSGEIEEVLKIVVNDIEIPIGVDGTNMTGTGWFNVVSAGGRVGGFNLDFTDGAGSPLGDPYGSMAYASVVVPNAINDGKSLPQIKVLAKGLKLPQYGASGDLTQEAFSNNPAWVLLDVFRRSGWALQDINLSSFKASADFCALPVSATDPHGNQTEVPSYQCNLVLQRRRSAGDVVRGIRIASGLIVRLGIDGKLEILPESAIAKQQPVKAPSSNSLEPLNGGWPAYDFGDGSNGYSGILRRANGEPAIRFWSRSNADTVNRFSTEFQDELNEYQQDSLSLVDLDDVSRVGQEINSSFLALGLPNFSQAGRGMETELLKSVEGNRFVDFETSVRALGLLPGDLIAITYAKEGLERECYRILRITPSMNYHRASVTAQLHSDAWYMTDGSVGPGSRLDRPENRMPRPLAGTFANPDGSFDFAISESASAGTDSSMSISLSVGYSAPQRVTGTSAFVPILGLSTAVDDESGTLPGGQVFYYGITAVDQSGGESGLSFLARAVTSNIADTNRVSLSGISLPPIAVGFNVYRGSTPGDLLLIASVDSLATSFVDDGKQVRATRPPDASFDHANFYWRPELVPETPTTIFSPQVVGNDSLQMAADVYRGMVARIIDGRGAGEEAIISGNDSTTLTIQGTWGVLPDASSQFVVAEPSWRFGARVGSSPASFEIPNRGGTTIHVLGRSANALEEECPIQVSPITRWRIGGAGQAGADADTPADPIFSLSPTGRGSLEISGVGFSDFVNTRTIAAGTLRLGFWNELYGDTPFSLAADVASTDDTLPMATPGPGAPGQWLQLGDEILVVSEVLDGGRQYKTTRGSHETNPVAHTAGTKLYHLARKTYVLPFVKDFFGSPLSGDYSFTIPLSDARVSAAEMFVTNSRGNSQTTRYAFTSTTDSGIRTLSGGQMALQVEGYLAVQTNAAPSLSADAAHAVRDIFATVKEAPSLGAISLALNVNGAQWASLLIPAGAKQSSALDGFGMAPLPGDGTITLDVIGVGATANPGRDLTVTIRL